MIQQAPTGKDTSRRHVLISRTIPLFLLIIPFLYILTLANDIVFGDPTEYTFVANILGIAHPPGYPVITLLGKLFQTLIPIGDIPWRSHLLSAAAATAAAFAVYGIIVSIGSAVWNHDPRTSNAVKLAAVFGALTVATAANFWQHSIHANPHIMTAAFLAVNLFLLTRWWACQPVPGSEEVGHRNRWLYLFSFSAGVGVTHHPLTIFSFPAFLIFIIWVKPTIWREWRTWLKMLAFAILGLAVWLYFPIRSSMEPLFGPADMNTLDGFLNHVMARGISESIPFFGLADQADRGLVFWSLLRLQYSLTTIFLAVLGLVWLLFGRQPYKNVFSGSETEKDKKEPQETPAAWSPSIRPLGSLISIAFLANYLFVMNLRQQDVMAYLLGLILLVGLLAGIGLLGVVDMLKRRALLDVRMAAPIFAVLFLLGPILQVIRSLPIISLNHYDEAEKYKETVFSWFDGKNEGAVLLNDWEHMTPLWYAQYVEDRWPDPQDVTAHLVSTDRPWLESVYDFLPGGPVYLSGYRPELVSAGFRLRPRGPFYEVLEPGSRSLSPELEAIDPISFDDVEILGYRLFDGEAAAGDYIPLTLAMRTPQGTEDFYTPVVFLGQGPDQIELEFTTDSHLVTPSWEPREVIIDRFDFTLPSDVEADELPVTITMRNLSKGTDPGSAITLGSLEIDPGALKTIPNNILANFRQRVGLVSASARVGISQGRSAPWAEPILVSPGDTIHLTLGWQSLAQADDSYTVFVHLIDLANKPYVALDYTPLGGSAPTHLWIPKWLPGQRYTDPYRLEIPAELPPGDYLIEVGLYEMTSGRRLHISDGPGNLVGDRYILGPIEVEGEN